MGEVELLPLLQLLRDKNFLLRTIIHSEYQRWKEKNNFLLPLQLATAKGKDGVNPSILSVS